MWEVRELEVLLLQNYDIEKLGYAKNWNIAWQMVCVSVVAWHILTSQSNLHQPSAFETVLDLDIAFAADTLYTSGSSMAWFSFAAEHLALQIHDCSAGIAGIAGGAAVLLQEISGRYQEDQIDSDYLDNLGLGLLIYAGILGPVSLTWAAH